MESYSDLCGGVRHLGSAPFRTIDVQIFPAFTTRLTKAWLRDVAEQALCAQESVVCPNVSLVIADDETMQRLNLEYRDLDETTDVLAFPLWTSSKSPDIGSQEFKLPPDEEVSMGEIVISYPQAVRQARDGKKTIRSEIALLIVHGVLHLLGYDHMDPREESAMWAKQDEVLTRLSMR